MLFDTDVLIWAARGNARASAWIDRDQDRSVSIVSVMELMQGARSKAEMKTIRQSLRDTGFQVHPVTEDVSATAAALMEDYALSTGLQVADAFIAAAAIHTSAVLVTANQKHFRAIRKLTLRAFTVA